MGKDRVDNTHRNDDLRERQRKRLVDEFFQKPETELQLEYSKCLLVVKQLEMQSYSSGSFRGLYEDVTHDAVLAIYSGERPWDPEKCSFVSMARGVAKSLFSNGARDGKRRSELNKEFEQDTVEPNHADAIMEARENERMLRRVFSTLRRDDPDSLNFLKEAIHSKIFKRMEDQEIAKEMGLSKSAFSRLQSRVLDKVARLRRTGRLETYQAGDDIQRVPGEKK